MFALRVVFKPYTSCDWATEKLLDLGLKAPQIDKEVFNILNPVLNVYVDKQDRLRYSRAIRRISPQIVSVSWA